MALLTTTSALFLSVMIAVIIGGLLWAVSTGHKGRLDPATGDLVMRFSLPARASGTLATLIGVIGFPAWIVIRLIEVAAVPDDFSGWSCYCCLSIILFYSIFGCAFFFLRVHFRHIIVTTSGIEYHRLWHIMERLRWDEVTTVRVGKGGALVLKGSNYRSILVPREMTGVELLIALMQKYLPPEVYQPGLQELEDYRNGKLFIR
jgi:hypothetical protein